MAMNDRPAIPASLPDVGSYHDLRSLDRLRTLGLKDEKAALTAAAQQFESTFLQELLKSMRAANEVFEDDEIFGGGASEFYEQMHDEQLALSLANQQSLGLAEVMVRQLSRQQSADGGVKGNGGFGNRETGTLSAPPVRPPLQAAANTAPPSPLAFVQQILPAAEQAARQLGMAPELLVAQAALETGWGKSLPGGNSAATAGNSHQYFGIKADSRWQGKTASATTLEYRNGVPQRERATFRAYDTVAAAFADYADFLQRSPRYADALASAADPKAFAVGLQQGGYATDPAYADKLLRVFKSSELRDLIAEARKLL